LLQRGHSGPAQAFHVRPARFVGSEPFHELAQCHPSCIAKHVSQSGRSYLFCAVQLTQIKLVIQIKLETVDLITKFVLL
jgi:hypothetical protein